MTNIEPSIILHPGEIALHPLNSNQHSKAHIAELAEGLREFTQYANIAVWGCPETIETKNGQGELVTLKKGITYVLKGNGLVQALWQLGWDQVEVKDLSSLSFDKSLLLLEYDNASPLNSTINPIQMKANLERVRNLWVNNDKLKSVLERAKGLAGVVDDTNKDVDAGPQMDKAAELQGIWKVQVGDLWGMGKFAKCPKCGKVHNLD